MHFYVEAGGGSKKTHSDENNMYRQKQVYFVYIFIDKNSN